MLKLKICYGSYIYEILQQFNKMLLFDRSFLCELGIESNTEVLQTQWRRINSTVSQLPTLAIMAS